MARSPNVRANTAPPAVAAMKGEAESPAPFTSVERKSTEASAREKQKAQPRIQQYSRFPRSSRQVPQAGGSWVAFSGGRELPSASVARARRGGSARYPRGHPERMSPSPRGTTKIMVVMEPMVVRAKLLPRSSGGMAMPW